MSVEVAAVTVMVMLSVPTLGVVSRVHAERASLEMDLHVQHSNSTPVVRIMIM